MLTTARPIFEHVPASFADPVGLADQQAQGVVSLIVVRYGANNGPSASGDGHGALGPTFDAFVAASGQLLAVARTTTDYRFPVMPAAALSRFIEHRDAGHDTFLSLFELEEADCARFLETVFYSECLKLHVEGAESAPLVAHQIARSGCGNGVLEVNDFSDPARPRVSLIDLAEIVTPEPTEEAPQTDTAALAHLLAPHLDGVAGRVLLYDREKNRATLPDRTGRAFDLDGIIAQANRLAEARRGKGAAHGPSGDAAAIAMQRTAAELRATAPDDQADAVEDYLRDRATRPRLVEPTHPHATGLGALVAELQGARPSATLATSGPLPRSGLALDVMGAPPDPLAVDSQPSQASAPEASGDGAADTAPPLPPVVHCEHPSDSTPLPVAPEAALAPTIATLPSSPPALNPQSPSPAPKARHPLATELDRLRTDVFELFENAVGRERAVAHEAHVLDDTGIASPVSPEDTVAYLRALLTSEPPKRWHFFKRSRAKIYEEVAGKLLAFHAANGHLDDPVIHEVTKLWTRLHK